MPGLEPGEIFLVVTLIDGPDVQEGGLDLRRSSGRTAQSAIRVIMLTGSCRTRSSRHQSYHQKEGVRQICSSIAEENLISTPQLWCKKIGWRRINPFNEQKGDGKGLDCYLVLLAFPQGIFCLGLSRSGGGSRNLGE